jgi:hypothetical protein
MVSLLKLSGVAMTTFMSGSVAAESLLTTGSYEVISRLELPHVERWAVDHSATICIGDAAPGALPIPVLSANHPFDACHVQDVETMGATLHYSISCPGRGAASAKATYSLSPRGFSGRIDMIMGAKNMTMTEIQDGRRLGDCPTVDPVHRVRF